jgi:hypothetical protein
VVTLEAARVANFCPRNFGELSYRARQAQRRMRRRPALVTAVWEQAELFPLKLCSVVLMRCITKLRLMTRATAAVRSSAARRLLSRLHLLRLLRVCLLQFLRLLLVLLLCLLLSRFTSILFCQLLMFLVLFLLEFLSILGLLCD